MTEPSQEALDLARDLGQRCYSRPGSTLCDGHGLEALRRDGLCRVGRVRTGLIDAALAKTKAEGHRDGYETARGDLVSGAFVGGPTYEALRDSFTGRKIAADAWDEGVRTALDYAVRNDNGITLHLDRRNPYRAAEVRGGEDRG